MALARETVRLGLGARGKAKIKVRQPLGEAVVVADGREREAIERLADIVREELNVKRVRFVEAASELARYEVKANYRTLGPLFGKDMPLAADAIAALDPARVAAVMRGADGGAADGDAHDGDGGSIGITVGGREHTLSAEDVILTMRAPEGYAVERDGAHAVALELAIDDELRAEGRAREVVHAVQNARKAAGLQVEDRIELSLRGEAELMRASRAPPRLRRRRDARRRARDRRPAGWSDAGRVRWGLLRRARRRRPRPRDHAAQGARAGWLSRGRRTANDPVRPRLLRPVSRGRRTTNDPVRPRLRRRARRGAARRRNPQAAASTGSSSCSSFFFG